MRDTDHTADLPIVMATTDSEFEALFRAHYRRLCRVIYRVVGETDLAEALAGEAFWKLHRKRPALLTNAEAWLCRTGIRLALDHLRKERRRRRYEALAYRARVQQDGLQADVSDSTRSGPQGPRAQTGYPSALLQRGATEPATPPDSETRLARAEDRDRVRQVLAAMKPAQAALLLLRAEGLSYAELAATLRLTPSSIGTLLARAEARFKQEYEARHGHE